MKARHAVLTAILLSTTLVSNPALSIDCIEHGTGFRPASQFDFGLTRNLTSQGTLALLANGWSGLTLVDFTVSNLPIDVAELGGLGLAVDVAVDGDQVLVAGQTDFHVIDITDPTSPGLRDSYVAGTPGRSVAFAGAGGLFLEEGTLHVVDLSDLDDIEILGSLTLAGSGHSVEALDSYAFVTSEGAGLHIIDLTNPASPALVETVDDVDAGDLTLAGDLACYTVAEEGVRIVDVSDPVTPIVSATISLNGDEATALDAIGSTLHVSTKSAGLWEVGLDDLVGPTAVLIEPNAADATGIAHGLGWVGAVLGPNAWGMSVLTPTTPGPYLVGESTAGGMQNADIEGEIAFLAVGSNGLAALDIADATTPSLLDRWTGSTSVLDVRVSGDYAYVADGANGLTIIDASSPTALTWVSSLPFGGEARAVDVVGGLAYVAEWDEGLQIVDVSSPAAPFVRSSVETPNFPLDVRVSNGYAYIADRVSGLQIVDVSDPDAPVLVGSLDTQHLAVGLHIEDGIAYVADGAGGLWIIDVSDPSDPILLRQVTGLGGNLDKVSVSDGYAYLLVPQRGMRILDVHDPANPWTVADNPIGGTSVEVLIEDSVLLWGISNKVYLFPGQCGQTTSIEGPISPRTFRSSLVVSPLPSSGRTTISYEIERPGPVDLMIFDVAGRAIRTIKDGGRVVAGRHESSWDGRDDAGRMQGPGVYFARLGQGGAYSGGRIVLVR